MVAAASFGAAIVLGALVGSPMHGVLAGWLGECFSVAGRGGTREARVLLLLMGATTLIAALGGCLMGVAILTHSSLLGDAIVGLLGTFLLGSLGLQARTPPLRLAHLRVAALSR